METNENGREQRETKTAPVQRRSTDDQVEEAAHDHADNDEHDEDHDQFADQVVDQPEKPETKQTKQTGSQQQRSVSDLGEQAAESDQSDRRRSPQTADEHASSFDPEEANVNRFVNREHRKS